MGHGRIIRSSQRPQYKGQGRKRRVQMMYVPPRAVCRVGLRGRSCSAVCVCVSPLLEVLTGVPQTRAKRDPSTSTVFKGFAPCVAISVLMFGAEYHEPCGLSPQFASV